MSSIDQIWKTRLEAHLKEVQSYTKYMFNDHLIFVLVFLGAGGALSYQEWLKTMPDDFPVLAIITAVFALIITASSVRTLLKEPDLVFLLPLEENMAGYFQKALVYSFFSQLYVFLVAALVLSPMLFRAESLTGTDFLIICIQILLVKGWNLMLNFRISFYTEPSAKIYDFIVRLAINALTIFFLLSKAYIYVFIMYAVMAVLYIYFQKATKAKGVKWEKLIDLELEKKQSFYRIANLFTDVPKLKKKAKRRKYLDGLLAFVKYKQESMYSYLYTRAFFRSNDYLGIFLRLTIIGGIVLYIIPTNQFSVLAIAILVLYLTGIQMIGLYKHYDMLALPDLYPVQPQFKKAKFLKLLFIMIVSQHVILTLIALISGNIIPALILFAAGFIFAYGFVYLYVKSRLVKMDASVF
ncbi:ABC transporter permease [Metabacillus dongyingensis]|uniref:ABC transporter permease n=1 Tax=Metabacillus dongyingensis TaxID=2874282 RepID=UPI003B8C9D18